MGFLALIILFVPIGLAIAVAASGRVDAAWAEAAVNLGLRFHSGGLFGRRKIQGRTGSCTVLVETRTKGSSNNARKTNTFYRISYPSLGLGLVLERQGSMAGIAKFFGAQDHELGDRRFDETVVVKAARPQAAREFLDEERRRRILEFFALHPGARIADEGIEFSTSGAEKQYQVIEAHVESSVTLAEELIGVDGSALANTLDAVDPVETGETGISDRADDMTDDDHIAVWTAGAAAAGLLPLGLEDSDDAAPMTLAEELGLDFELAGYEPLDREAQIAGSSERIGARLREPSGVEFVAPAESPEAEAPPEEDRSQAFASLRDAHDEPPTQAAVGAEPATQTDAPQPEPEPEPEPELTASPEFETEPEPLQPEAPAAPPAESMPAAGRPVSIDEIHAALFSSTLMSLEAARIFSEHFADAPVDWHGKLKQLSRFYSDPVFGKGPGTLATVELAGLTHDARPTEAVVQLPESARDALASQVGARLDFRGHLARCDVFMRRLYVARGELTPE